MFPSKLNDNQVHEGYTSVNLIYRGIRLPAATGYEQWFRGDEHAVALSTLQPGGYLLPHRDKGPHYTRTQIPLEPAGWYWDELQGVLRFDQVGESYPVNHHLPHAVWNDSDTVRVTLVVDRYPIHADLPFETYPTSVCPELESWLGS